MIKFIFVYCSLDLKYFSWSWKLEPGVLIWLRSRGDKSLSIIPKKNIEKWFDSRRNFLSEKTPIT